MAFKIKESFQIGSKTVLDANSNLSVLNAVIQSAAGKDTIEILGNANTSEYKVSLTNAALTANRTLTLPNKTGTIAVLDDITSGASLTDPIIDNIKASAENAATDLWSEVQSGSITIGAGLTTGSLNIAASGTGATAITLGHTNATLGITSDKFTVTSGSGNTSIGGTLGVTGITTLTGALNANGGIACDTNKFTVADGTGDTSIAGTLAVTGATTLTGALTANGGISCDGGVFTVADTTGNVGTSGTLTVTNATDSTTTGTGSVVISGGVGIAKAVNIGTTLGVTGATTLTGALNANGGIACDTNKFTVADGTGNVATAGTLSAAGDFKVNTNKFVVTASSGDTSVGGNLTVAGNLTVSGTTTTINTETLLLADNLITLNSNYTGDTPSENAGIEVERGTVDNAFVRWNETSDYWELGVGASATGRILTTADEGHTKGIDSDTLDGQEGSYYLNYQNFTNVPSTYTPNVNNFGTVVVSGQSNVVADAVSDTLTLAVGTVDSLAGLTITTNATNDTITIGHADTSSVANLSSDNSANTFVQDISFTFDTYGHVTAASVATADVTIGNGTLTLGVSGNGLTGSQTFTANQTGNVSFTVASNATASADASTIVFRDANKDFAANIVTVEGLNKDSTVYSRYATATVATTDSTAIDTWAKATYRSCKYVIQITQGTNYQVSELLVVHNGTAASTTEYAIVETNGSLATLSADVDGTNVSLKVVMGAATSATIKIDKTLIAV